MFSKDSRYASLPERELEPAGGGPPIRYISRRLVPMSAPVRREIPARGPLRLDLLANHELGKSDYFWRICDVNAREFNPFALELSMGMGEMMKIPDF